MLLKFPFELLARIMRRQSPADLFHRFSHHLFGCDHARMNLVTRSLRFRRSLSPLRFSCRGLEETAFQPTGPSQRWGKIRGLDRGEVLPPSSLSEQSLDHLSVNICE